jgi:hypothetical protein
MSSLWKITQDIRELEDAIAAIQDKSDLSDTEKDEQTKEVFNAWLGHTEQFNIKAEAIANYILSLEYQADLRELEALRIKQEHDRILKLAKKPKAKANQLKRYLAENMQSIGTKKIEGDLVQLRLRKVPDKLVISCGTDSLPQELCRITVEPDLPKIRKRLVAGESIPGAELVEVTEKTLLIN